jgi:lipopolysaccharide export system protein LptA
MALKTDKNEDFILDADNNSAILKTGQNQQKFWGNVVIQQGTMKINADSAIVENNKTGIQNILLSGRPVTMEQVIDAEYGKIDVRANNIDYKVANDLLEMTGNVSIKSKLQGEMTGEKITMNLKTKEIVGAKSGDKRVRLVIKQNNSND